MSWLNDEEFLIYLHGDEAASIAECMFPECFDDSDDNDNKGITSEQMKQVKIVMSAVYEVGIIVNVKTGKIRLED